jgi:hypothetical protein
MEARSQEFAAYRFHRKARLMARMMFFWNLGAGNYVFACFYHFWWVWEIVATENHKRQLKGVQK